MHTNQEYFIAQGTNHIKGELQKFISRQQAQWRPIQKLQKQPLQRISRYIRSIQYTPFNTRTVQTLKRSLIYLIQNIFPILFKKNITLQERTQIAIFLQQRLKSIRCEYFVQGVIYPNEALKIVRCNILIQLLKGDDANWQQFAGLDDLLSEQHRQIMKTRYPKQYEEALKYSICILSKKNIEQTVWSNPQILQKQHLNKLLQLRLKIQSGNFQAYFNALSQQEIIVKCLLWRLFPQIKIKLINILKKAFGDVRIDWILKRLGFQELKVEQWISLKKSELPQTNYIGFALWIDPLQLPSLIE